MPAVSFFNADANSKIKNKLRLKRFLPALFSDQGKKLHSLAIIFCSDEFLLNLNREFLNHDYYTDILTFDLSTNGNLIAEIYISNDRIKENSIALNISFQEELTRIIFHGALHLCGFSDKSKALKQEMTLKENDYLSKFAQFHVKQ